jgi:hypothetical protein
MFCVPIYSKLSYSPDELTTLSLDSDIPHLFWEILTESLIYMMFNIR